ncbi:MAG: ABC transporter permease subunit [Methanomicrobiales archaeon]
MDPPLFLTQIPIPALWQGLIVAVDLVALTTPFGLLLGIGTDFGRQYWGKGLSSACAGNIIFFKGYPLILLLFMLYFWRPSVRITLPAFTAAVLGFILCNPVYNSEYISGAILSIKDGQITAMQALGMARFQTIKSIVPPQAIHRAVPG